MLVKACSHVWDRISLVLRPGRCSCLRQSDRAGGDDGGAATLSGVFHRSRVITSLPPFPGFLDVGLSDDSSQSPGLPKHASCEPRSRNVLRTLDWNPDVPPARQQTGLDRFSGGLRADGGSRGHVGFGLHGVQWDDCSWGVVFRRVWSASVFLPRQTGEPSTGRESHRVREKQERPYLKLEGRQNVRRQWN